MDKVEEIKQKLTQIEQTENVQILFAIESGSRAWGFASPDSDYDVRFIYKRMPEFYLQLNKRRDVIEFPPDEIFDINGWDLDKTLHLLHTSNPTLFEWINSPIVYKTTLFHEEFKTFASKYFLSKSGLYHYLSMAEGNYREYLKGDIVKLKKYFYVIRPLLACRWILKNNTPPPMLFSDLVNNCLEENLHDEINRLLAWKMSAPESETGKRIEVLNQWLETNLKVIKEQISLLPKENRQGWEALNQLFCHELMIKNTLYSSKKIII